MVFKIGTKLSEVKTYVSSNQNFSDASKKAIFNFIDEDLDGQVTNDIEKAMLDKLLKQATNPNKKFKLKAPTLQADKPGTVIEKNNPNKSDVGGGVIYPYKLGIKQGNRHFAVGTLGSDMNRYKVENGNQSDTIYTDSNNRALRRVVTNEVNDNITATYYDDDLDGSFDRKSVTNNDVDVNYIKDKKTNGWILDTNG